MNKQKKQFVVVVILMAVCIIGYFGVKFSLYVR